ncbi:MFS transporter (macronuclear) [Tetrahymena thermophila SB210]|uniref:MFS transporter n=1 Tax=Tetrahymena thermophila (strain SB210) TaxID=312017 RepID=Q23R67_TETTS|nr:MFS transporter [Tetrahymena thermophila SB210]EAR99181.2 MFS transporter [Tetrahymena thermophila SB210]|eukprot:XP_001019426.2 MFS transporter [Tetrahymena thermophila SB210]
MLDSADQFQSAFLQPISLKPQSSSKEVKKYKYVFVRLKQKQKSQPPQHCISLKVDSPKNLFKTYSEPVRTPTNNQQTFSNQQFQQSQNLSQPYIAKSQQPSTQNQREFKAFYQRQEQNIEKQDKCLIDPLPLLMSEFHPNSGESIVSSLINNNNIDDLKKTIKETAYKPSVKEFQVCKYRHVVVILYGMALAIISLLFPLCNPIVNVVKQLYNVDTSIVNLNSLLFLLMHPLFTFPANFIIDQYGVKISITIGCVVCMAGAWLRMLVNQSFYIMIAGSILCGIGRPFILNCQGKIVANWFFPKDRSLITSLLSFILTSFTVIGLLFPGFVFNSYEQQDAKDDPDKGKSLMTRLVLIEACICTFCLLPNIFLQREKPPHPPSYTCTVQRQSPLEGLKSILKNTNFILLWIIYGIYFGSFNAVGIVQASIMDTYNIKSPSENSVIGSVPVASGFISVIFVSIILKKYYKFKLTLIIFIIGCVISITIMPQIIKYGYGAAIGSSLLNGVFVVPAVPLMLELGIELSFPVSEAIGVGLLFAGGQLWGTAIGSIVSIYCKGETQESSDAAIYTFSGLFGLALILCLFLKEDLRRLRAEKTKNVTSVHLTVNQWNQIKSEFGGDVYDKKDHQVYETESEDD